MTKDDFKNLKHWTYEGSDKCEVIILTGVHSSLQLFLLPPEFSTLVGPIREVETGQWLLKLVDYEQIPTLAPQTLAQGKTLDELLQPLKAYTDQYEANFDEILAALKTLEGAALVIEDPLSLVGRLIASFADAKVPITPALAAKRVATNPRFQDGVGVVASEYEYERLLQALVGLGVDKEEAEERIWMFERAHDVGEKLKPEVRAARAQA